MPRSWQLVQFLLWNAADIDRVPVFLKPVHTIFGPCHFGNFGPSSVSPSDNCPASTLSLFSASLNLVRGASLFSASLNLVRDGRRSASDGAMTESMSRLY